MSRNIQYNFIQLSTGKLIDAMKTDTNESMIRYKKKKTKKTKKKYKNNDINIGN